MRVRTPSDALYYVIARLPIILVVFGALWVLGAGAQQLEMISFGSEFFVGNHESSNLPPAIGPSDEDILTDALNSGDVDRMSAALEQVEVRQTALATRPAAG